MEEKYTEYKNEREKRQQQRSTTSSQQSSSNPVTISNASSNSLDLETQSVDLDNNLSHSLSDLNLDSAPNPEILVTLRPSQSFTENRHKIEDNEDDDELQTPVPQTLELGSVDKPNSELEESAKSTPKEKRKFTFSSFLDKSRNSAAANADPDNNEKESSSSQSATPTRSSLQAATPTRSSLRARMMGLMGKGQNNNNQQISTSPVTHDNPFTGKVHDY